MLIEVKRFERTALSTISRCFVDGNFVCYMLEDCDRGLTQEMPLDELLERKIKSKTAIPTGKYQLKITYSNRFKKYLPQIMNVPAFEGIRIHSGNTDADTEGCLLTGTDYEEDVVHNSRIAFSELFSLIENCKEEIEIEIS